jgi:hypothetical protein
MRVSLNNQGYNIGIHQTAILMKQANIVAIRPRKRHYCPDAGTRYKKAEVVYLHKLSKTNLLKPNNLTNKLKA